jgi:hypothetical protein
MPQLVRVATNGRTLGVVERALAHGQPSEAALNQVQKLLVDEERQAWFLAALRGDRAHMDRMLAALQTRQLAQEDAEIGLAWNKPDGTPEEPWFRPDRIAVHRARLLAFMTYVVEIVRNQPEEQQLSLIERLNGLMGKEPHFIETACGAVNMTAKTSHRDKARLRCAIAGLGAERYRQRFGHWPESLDALVPEFLSEVPKDPFDGTPLRYRVVAGGVVIHSVGPKLNDMVITLDESDPQWHSTHVGFRLWDVPNRGRQP